MKQIDGRHGEGGGQILRTSLSLSALTQTPIHVHHVRGGRAKPGLLRQHLTALNAVATITGGVAEGAFLRSDAFVFTPGAIKPGDYTFDIQTAGSVNLVLQTVLPVLMTATQPSTLTLRGGTHNPMSPTADYMRTVFLPLLARLGPRCSLEVVKHGFFPAGGGEIKVTIAPEPLEAGFSLLSRGATLDTHARILSSNLPRQVARRQTTLLAHELDLSRSRVQCDLLRGPGPGNVILVDVQSEHVTEQWVGFGARGLRSEELISRLSRSVHSYLRSDIPIGEYLADQLLLPLALAGHGVFRTKAPSSHTLTNAEMIERFLPVRFEFQQEPTGTTVCIKQQ